MPPSAAPTAVPQAQSPWSEPCQATPASVPQPPQAPPSASVAQTPVGQSGGLPSAGAPPRASSKPRKRRKPNRHLPAPLLLVLAWYASVTVWVAMPQELRNLLLLSLCTSQPSVGDAQRWTLRKLQHWVKEQFSRTVSIETLRRVLQDLGFSWKKARKLLARADTIARFVFLQQLEPLLQQADQGRVLLAYIDEAHIHCDCDLGYTWGVRGEPALVHSRSPGLSYKATFYGIYLLPLARVHIWPKPRADTAHTQEILCRLRQTYPTQPLCVLWDGASYHRSQALREVATELGIALLPLPGYSPDFMPVEALWRWLRQSVTYNRCHDTVAALLGAVADFEATINLDPAALVARLAVKTSLNLTEEEVRISNLL